MRPVRIFFISTVAAKLLQFIEQAGQILRFHIEKELAAGCYTHGRSMAALSQAANMFQGNINIPFGDAVLQACRDGLAAFLGT